MNGNLLTEKELIFIINYIKLFDIKIGFTPKLNDISKDLKRKCTVCDELENETRGSYRWTRENISIFRWL